MTRARSYFRVPTATWEPQHYAARWTPQDPAPEWWATIDAAWMIDRLDLPSVRDIALQWGWTRTRTAGFLNRMIGLQAADEPSDQKRVAILALRAERAPAINAPGRASTAK